MYITCAWLCGCGCGCNVVSCMCIADDDCQPFKRLHEPFKPLGKPFKPPGQPLEPLAAPPPHQNPPNGCHATIPAAIPTRGGGGGRHHVPGSPWGARPKEGFESGTPRALESTLAVAPGDARGRVVGNPDPVPFDDVHKSTRNGPRSPRKSAQSSSKTSHHSPKPASHGTRGGAQQWTGAGPWALGAIPRGHTPGIRTCTHSIRPHMCRSASLGLPCLRRSPEQPVAHRMPGPRRARLGRAQRVRQHRGRDSSARGGNGYGGIRGDEGDGARTAVPWPEVPFGDHNGSNRPKHGLNRPCETPICRPRPPPPPSGRCFFTRPWTVTRSSLRMLRWVAAFCRPLRPALPLVSFPHSRGPVVGVLGLCWMWRDVPCARQPPPHIWSRVVC